MLFFLDRKKNHERGAVVIGINQYQNENWNLRGCVNDAIDMRQLLKNVYRFQDTNMRQLFNQHATKYNILKGLEWLGNKFQEGVMFFSGHGSQIFATDEPDQKCEILITYDHDWYNPLLDDDLYERLHKMSRCWIIVDACHAEGISRDEQYTVKSIIPPPNIPFPKKRKLSKPTRLIELAACKADEISLEKPYKGVWRGQFTKILCDILREESTIQLPDLQQELISRAESQTPVITPLTRIRVLS